MHYFYFLCSYIWSKFLNRIKKYNIGEQRRGLLLVFKHINSRLSGWFTLTFLCRGSKVREISERIESISDCLVKFTNQSKLPICQCWIWWNAKLTVTQNCLPTFRNWLKKFDLSKDFAKVDNLFGFADFLAVMPNNAANTANGITFASKTSVCRFGYAIP